MTTISVIRRPVKLEAIQWTGGNWVKIMQFAGDRAMRIGKSIGGKEAIALATSGGKEFVEDGEWIVKLEDGSYERETPAGFTRKYMEAKV